LSDRRQGWSPTLQTNVLVFGHRCASLLLKIAIVKNSEKIMLQPTWLDGGKALIRTGTTDIFL
jgi:hypothetical protein